MYTGLSTILRWILHTIRSPSGRSKPICTRLRCYRGHLYFRFGLSIWMGPGRLDLLRRELTNDHKNESQLSEPKEIPPARLRTLQMGMATASQWLFNFVVAKSTPSMFATLGTNGFGTYFLYGSFCFSMVVLAWFFVPETSGKTHFSFHLSLISSGVNHL